MLARFIVIKERLLLIQLGSGNQFKTSKAPGANVTVISTSNEIVNPIVEAVTILQRDGDEQVAFKGVVSHKKITRKENVKVQQGQLVLKENTGNQLQNSEPRCDDPGILAGKTFNVIVVL